MTITKLIINAALGTEEIIELSADEAAEHAKLQTDHAKADQDIVEAEAEKTAIKAAIANRLGLSIDELTTLLS